MTNYFMKIKHIAVGLIAVLSMMAATTGIASAETATLAVTGTSLSVSTTTVGMSDVALSGTAQTSTSESTVNNWTVNDATGTGAGWTLTIISTAFVDTTATTPYEIDSGGAGFDMGLMTSDIARTSGNTSGTIPTVALAALTAIPFTTGTAMTFVTAAAGEGMGSYLMHPNFSLVVPADTYVGAGTYTATMTVTAAPTL